MHGNIDTRLSNAKLALGGFAAAMGHRGVKFHVRGALLPSVSSMRLISQRT